MPPPRALSSFAPEGRAGRGAWHFTSAPHPTKPCRGAREGKQAMVLKFNLDGEDAWRPDFIRSSIQIEYDLANENYYT